ncbi:hypothetical protein DPEC_G00313260 [Dallia pectoralis]|uniref:Uncharacterized protein n=1 Tax=Dallia pectoralis TaxID=75939 RepID=A0ACC2FC39_DALPE|nr:hypothetical protein DPEC_G00313260 [Dallia pectoralis]
MAKVVPRGTALTPPSPAKPRRSSYPAAFCRVIGCRCCRGQRLEERDCENLKTRAGKAKLSPHSSLTDHSLSPLSSSAEWGPAIIHPLMERGII